MTTKTDLQNTYMMNRKKTNYTSEQQHKTRKNNRLLGYINKFLTRKNFIIRVIMEIPFF